MITTLPLMLLAASAWLAGTSASAEPAPAASLAPAPALDPNQRICETVTQIGTRLAAKKICATRAEWAERRKQDRAAVDEMQRLQGRPCANVQHGTGSSPAC
jgi:hypothetical protein